MTYYIGTVPIPQSTQTRQTYVATSGQTSFGTNGYLAGGTYTFVFKNGVLLRLGTEYTAADGQSIVLSSGATAGDIIDFLSFSTFETGAPDAVSANSGGSFGGSIFVDGKIGLDANDYVQWTNNTQLDFYVNGNNEFRMTAAGDFHADGNVIAYSTTIASDAALKENIQPVSGLQSVMALNGVSFDWKRDGKKSAGVIAQEVREVMPEAVSEVTALDGSKHLSVNYNALTSLLIEAVKDLKKEIEVLKNGASN
jgi:hypothetical protein